MGARVNIISRHVDIGARLYIWARHDINAIYRLTLSRLYHISRLSYVGAHVNICWRVNIHIYRRARLYIYVGARVYINVFMYM